MGAWRELHISRYEYDKRRKQLALLEDQLRTARTRVLAKCRTNDHSISRAVTIWDYLSARQRVAEHRDRLSRVVVLNGHATARDAQFRASQQIT